MIQIILMDENIPVSSMLQHYVSIKGLKDSAFSQTLAIWRCPWSGWMHHFPIIPIESQASLDLMGECFIADMQIGIRVTGDQMLFTLSHPPQVQWPSNYVRVCVLPCRCWRVSWCCSSVRWSDTFSPWVIWSAEMKSRVVGVVYRFRAQIKSVNLRIRSIATALTQVTATCRVTSWHSAPDLTNGNACLGICKSVTPVRVCGYQSEVTSRCQRKMSLHKRFASSLKLRHRVGCLTAWCDGGEMCRSFPGLLCRTFVLLFGGIKNVPASTMTTMTMTLISEVT